MGNITYDSVKNQWNVNGSSVLKKDDIVNLNGANGVIENLPH